MIRLLTLIGMVAAPVAHAAIPSVPCSPLQPGCGQGPGNPLLNGIEHVGGLLLTSAAALSVLFLVWSGFQMVIALGDESKIAQHRWGVIYAIGGLLLAMVSQLIVSVVGTQDYLMGGGILPVSVLTAIVHAMLTLLNIVFLIVIVFAGMRMVYAQGKSDEFNKGRTAVTWAIIGAVVVNVANALLQAFIDFI